MKKPIIKYNIIAQQGIIEPISFDIYLDHLKEDDNIAFETYFKGTKSENRTDENKIYVQATITDIFHHISNTTDGVVDNIYAVVTLSRDLLGTYISAYNKAVKDGIIDITVGGASDEHNTETKESKQTKKKS